ncbi:MAG: T9SS type A sorting domain-containing protein, partial [Ferruginibacter sp.]
VTNDCGTATSATWTVELSDEVEIPLTQTPNTNNLCNGPITISVNGAFNGLEWSSGQTNTNAIVVTEPGDYSVVGQDPTGCPASSVVISIIETVPPPLTTIPVSPLTLCGASATITASAGFAVYAWSNGQMGNTATVTNPGIITVTATTNDGCIVQSAPIDIITGSSVSIPVEPSIAAICDGIPAEITAGDGFTNYTWSNGSTGQVTTVSSTGFYSVTAEDGNGCPGSSPLVEVIESQFPIANFSYEQNEGGYTINFDNLSQNALDYEWTFDSVGTSPLNDPSLTFPDFGPYTISLIIENPCGRDTIDKLIVVAPVGIEDVQSIYGLSVFPNPASELIYIAGTVSKPGMASFSLLDVTGRVVLNKQYFIEQNFQQSIFINNLQKGMYIIDIVHNGSKKQSRYKKK